MAAPVSVIPVVRRSLLRGPFKKPNPRNWPTVQHRSIETSCSTLRNPLKRQHEPFDSIDGDSEFIPPSKRIRTFKKTKPKKIERGKATGPMELLLKYRISSLERTTKSKPSDGQGASPLVSLDATEFRTATSYYPNSFTIHEDTADQETDNLLTHSTQTMDISEDQGTANEEIENHPTHSAQTLSTSEGKISTTVPKSRRKIKTAMPRIPLGNIDVAKLYGDTVMGVDETG